MTNTYDKYFAKKASNQFTVTFRKTVIGTNNNEYVRTSMFSSPKEMFSFLDEHNYDVVNIHMSSDKASVLYNER